MKDGTFVTHDEFVREMDEALDAYIERLAHLGIQVDPERSDESLRQELLPLWELRNRRRMTVPDMVDSGPFGIS